MSAESYESAVAGPTLARELSPPASLAALHAEVAGWFRPAGLNELLGAATCPTAHLARQQLARGHRWRPVLTAVAARCGTDRPAADSVRRAAVAVECMHKASLVHDDIADADETRYAAPTLHRLHGPGVALNVGDLLIGEGYRLLAEAPWNVATRVGALRAAAEAHRHLCLGQGAELWSLRTGRPPAPRAVLEAFAGKTAPAFNLAMQLGAVLSGANAAARAALGELSEAMGTAYQIRDDLEDLRDEDAWAQPRRLCATLPLALAVRRANPAQRRVLEALWRADLPAPSGEQVRWLIAATDAVGRAAQIRRAYAERAAACLARPELKPIAPLLAQVLRELADNGA